jgi:hypothetical protein
MGKTSKSGRSKSTSENAHHSTGSAPKASKAVQKSKPDGSGANKTLNRKKKKMHQQQRASTLGKLSKHEWNRSKSRSTSKRKKLQIGSTSKILQRSGLESDSGQPVDGIEIADLEHDMDMNEIQNLPVEAEEPIMANSQSLDQTQSRTVSDQESAGDDVDDSSDEQNEDEQDSSEEEEEMSLQSDSVKQRTDRHQHSHEQHKHPPKRFKWSVEDESEGKSESESESQIDPETSDESDESSSSEESSETSSDEKSKKEKSNDSRRKRTTEHTHHHRKHSREKDDGHRRKKSKRSLSREGRRTHRVLKHYWGSVEGHDALAALMSVEEKQKLNEAAKSQEAFFHKLKKFEEPLRSQTKTVRESDTRLFRELSDMKLMYHKQMGVLNDIVNYKWRSARQGCLKLLDLEADSMSNTNLLRLSLRSSRGVTDLIREEDTEATMRDTYEKVTQKHARQQKQLRTLGTQRFFRGGRRPRAHSGHRRKQLHPPWRSGGTRNIQQGAPNYAPPASHQGTRSSTRAKTSTSGNHQGSFK